MAEKSINIASWPCLSNGLHYNWLVDYAAFSAFGTFELSAEEWEKRDLIVNFKGNSELTTEIDHQQAVDKAIDLVSSFLKAVFSEKEETTNSHSTLSQLTLVCLPASTRKQIPQVQRTGMCGNKYAECLQRIQFHNYKR